MDALFQGPGDTPVLRTAAAPTCLGETATVIGSPGVRTLHGTRGSDVIVTGGAPTVRAHAGNDLICVSGGTRFVFAAGGQDVVDTHEAERRPFIDLGSGDDTFDGGPRGDEVSGGSGADTIATGPGPDTYFSSFGSIDTVKLGTGNDTAFLASSNTQQVGSVVDGGMGDNHIDFGVDADGAAHAWVLHAADQTMTQDGSPFYQWTNFTGYSVGVGFGTFEFQGTDADEEVTVRREFEFGLRPNLHMAGGDDTVEFSGITGPAAGGAGRDTVVIGGFRDERSGDLPLLPLRVDLAAHIMAAEGNRSQLLSFENVNASGFRRMVLTGNRSRNRFFVDDACSVSAHGRGGRDIIGMPARFGCGTDQRLVTRLSGGAGDDTLRGRQTDDLLLGGPGTDLANGRSGRDQCGAETRVHCET
jgi:Ca2+-binding RTX toxin-like protein